MRGIERAWRSRWDSRCRADGSSGVLDELVAVHGCPLALRTDNGPEFTAQPFVDWCAEHGVALHYIQPGKPDQNAYIERFNRSYRTEVLNAHLFESIAELRALTAVFSGGALPQAERVFLAVRPPGCRSTTRSGRTTASAGCRPLRSCRGPQLPGSLSLLCLLDGEAYGWICESGRYSTARPG